MTDKTMTLIQQLRGRAAFLRDIGRVKSPHLMEQAADAIDERIKADEGAVAHDFARKLQFWFFRDLTNEQLLNLVGLSGLPIDEIGSVKVWQNMPLN